MYAGELDRGARAGRGRCCCLRTKIRWWGVRSPYHLKWGGRGTANAAGFVFVGRQEQGPGLINLRQQREFLFCWPKNRVRGWSHAAPWAARNQPLTRCRVQPLYSVGTTPAILKRFSTRWPEGYTEVSVSSSLPLCSVGEAAMLTTDTCRQTSLFLPAARGATMVNGRQMLYIYFICR